MTTLAVSAVPHAALLPARTRPQVEALFAFLLLGHDGEPPDSLDAATTARIREALAKDARTPRVRRWSELLAWCRFTAGPVAARVLALLEEDPRLTAAAEALGTAALLLRVVRDCREDFVARGRIYLPADWLREAGCAEADLGVERASPALRAVLSRVLERADRLLAEARPGIAAIRDRRLRRWGETALALAEAWSRTLARHDPLPRPVALGSLRRRRALVVGWWRARRR